MHRHARAEYLHLPLWARPGSRTATVCVCTAGLGSADPPDDGCGPSGTRNLGHMVQPPPTAGRQTSELTLAAGGWTGMPRITSRQCSRWGFRHSGRSPGPGAASGPRWRRRAWTRAGTSAGVRRTGTGLGDAGSHPNKAHAGCGRRAHRLEPDPDTAPVVTRMFSQRLAGHSAPRITQALNDAGVPRPSAGTRVGRCGTGSEPVST
jgi:hypothetical protein